MVFRAARPISRCFAVWVFLGSSALAADMSGAVRVTDGDTLGVRIRLWGIDAPEMKQTCQGKDGQTYECGRAAPPL